VVRTVWAYGWQLWPLSQVGAILDKLAGHVMDMLTTTQPLTFQGGVHPPGHKDLCEDKAISPGPAVKHLVILLSQHIGAVCKPLLKKGDTVQEGQKIGDDEAFVSAPVHSPVTGKVKDVCLQSHPVLGRCLGVVIDVDDPCLAKAAEDKTGRFAGDFYEAGYTPEQIRDAVRGAGIVGMGGAGFPTRVKIEPNPKWNREAIIVNGCECEPYIACDYRLMLERTDQILAGVRLARKAWGCKQAYIAIEDNKPAAIEAMKAALGRSGNPDGIDVVTVKTKYPQGGERQLIRAVLGKMVPTGGIPPMIGVLVMNVATAAAVADAVVFGHPLTHRVVTVTGQALARPGNFHVPIGTAVWDLIQFCGGVTEKAAKVVLGGPMMGIAIADLDTPITKTTNAVTVLTGQQIGRAKFAGRETPCIRCGRCIEACPENLNPTRIAHAVKKYAWEAAQDNYITACIECGCCSYVCPAKIELTGYIRTGKIFLARQQKKMPQ